MKHSLGGHFLDKLRHPTFLAEAKDQLEKIFRSEIVFAQETIGQWHTAE